VNSRLQRLAAGLVATGIATAGALLPAVSAGADPGTPHNPKVPTNIAGGQVIALRPHRADLIRNRVLVRVVPLPFGPIGLDTVVRAIGDERWASFSGGTVTLRAGILQRPKTELRIGPAVHTLRLVDSPDSPAYLSGSSATVVFNGVTVVSADGANRPAEESDHRPYVRYTHSSTINATGTTFQALGSRSSAAHHGVTIGAGGTITATESVFRDSGRGLDIYKAARVRLNRIAATGNGGPGVVITEAGDTTLADVTTSTNSTGLVLRGPLPMLTIADGINSHHNSTVGVEVTNLDKTPIGPLHTDHNQTGLLIRQCPNCVVAGLTSTADRRGAVIEKQSSGATLRDGTINQATRTGVSVGAPNAAVKSVDVSVLEGATSIRLAGTAGGAMVDGGTVGGGSVGVFVGASGTAVSNVTAKDAHTGFRVAGQVDGTKLVKITASQNTTGLVTEAGPGTVTVSGLRVSQTGGQGVRSRIAHFELTDARVVGATVGLNLRGHAKVTNSSVDETTEAVHTGGDAVVELTKVFLGARVLGLRVTQSAKVTLTDCDVSAPLGARGDVQIVGGTSFPALPLRWIGIFAVVALGSAVVLELMRKLRERGGHHERQVRAPAHVTNIA
jgi:hypothetical protein